MTIESPDLVRQNEARKMEIKKLTGEQHDKDYQVLVQTLKVNQRPIEAVIRMNGLLKDNERETLGKLLAATQSNNNENGRVAMQAYHQRRDQLTDENTANSDYARATMATVEKYLLQYGLKDTAFIVEGMGPDEIIKAVDTAYQAKMFRLTSRIED